MGTCEPEVVDDTRGFATGSVVDVNGNPLADIPIIIRPLRYDKILGQSSTDQNGKFKLVTTAFSSGNIQARINRGNLNESVDLQNPVYAAKTFTQDASKKRFKLGEIQLQKAASLDFSIQRTLQTADTLQWELLSTSQNCEIYLGEPQEDDPYYTDSCYAEFSIDRRQTPEEPNFEMQIKSLKGTEAIFIYKTENQAYDTISIPLTETENTYEFNY